jgi:hypothetical protein
MNSNLNLNLARRTLALHFLLSLSSYSLFANRPREGEDLLEMFFGVQRFCKSLPFVIYSLDSREERSPRPMLPGSFPLPLIL